VYHGPPGELKMRLCGLCTRNSPAHFERLRLVPTPGQAGEMSVE